MFEGADSQIPILETPPEPNRDGSASIEVIQKRIPTWLIVIILGLTILFLSSLIYIFWQQQQLKELSNALTSSPDEAVITETELVNDLVDTSLSSTFVPENIPVSYDDWIKIADIVGETADFVPRQDRFEIPLKNGIFRMEKIAGQEENPNHPQITDFCGFKLFYNDNLVKELNNCLDSAKYYDQKVEGFINSYVVHPENNMLALNVVGFAHPLSFAKESQYLIFDESTQQLLVTNYQWIDGELGWIANARGYYYNKVEPNPAYDANNPDPATYNMGGQMEDFNGEPNYLVRPYYVFF